MTTGARRTSSADEPDGAGELGEAEPRVQPVRRGEAADPIDIVTKEAVPTTGLESLNRTFAAANGTLVRASRYIELKFKPGTVGNITVGGKVYDFEKLHWNLPSVHTVNGQRFPMELHLVHRSADGGLAIIAVLYKVGHPESFYILLKKAMEEALADRCNFAEQESRVSAGKVLIMRALKRRAGSYFRYNGSLTVPPCTENVVWSVLARVRQISQEQLKTIMGLLLGSDARPAQPLNGRTVQFNNATDDNISFPM